MFAIQLIAGVAVSWFVAVDTVDFPNVVHAIVASTDGKKLFVLCERDGVYRVNMADFRKRKKIVSLEENSPTFSLSPDGKMFAVVGDGLTFYEAKSGRKVWGISNVGFLYAVDFSPCGSFVAVGGNTKLVYILDVAARRVIASYIGHVGSIACLKFSPDGKQIASGGGNFDRSIKIWNVKSGDVVGNLTGHANVVSCLAYSPDGSQLVSGSWDGTLKAWSIELKKNVGTFRGHKSGILSCAFDAHSERVVSSSTDRSIRVWDYKTRKLKGEIKDLKDVSYSVRFVGNETLVFGTGDYSKTRFFVTKKFISVR